MEWICVAYVRDPQGYWGFNTRKSTGVWTERGRIWEKRKFTPANPTNRKLPRCTCVLPLVKRKGVWGVHRGLTTPRSWTLFWNCLELFLLFLSLHRMSVPGVLCLYHHCILRTEALFQAPCVHRAWSIVDESHPKLNTDQSGRPWREVTVFSMKGLPPWIIRDQRKGGSRQSNGPPTMFMSLVLLNLWVCHIKWGWGSKSTKWDQVKDYRTGSDVWYLDGPSVVRGSPSKWKREAEGGCNTPEPVRWFSG